MKMLVCVMKNVCSKLQTSVHDILPPTAAIIGYTISPEKHFVCSQPAVSKIVTIQTNQIILECLSFIPLTVQIKPKLLVPLVECMANSGRKYNMYFFLETKCKLYVYL